MATNINYWYDTTNVRVKMRAGLPRNNTDVVIIGGGIAGLNTLHCLLSRGIDAILLEKNDVGFKASGRANGSVGVPSRIAKYPCSFDDLYGMVKTNNNILRRMIQTEGMDCHLDMCGEFQICTDDQSDKMVESDVHRAIMHMNKDLLDGIVPSKVFDGGLFMPVSFMVNSYRLLYCLVTKCESSGSRIFSHIDVKKITPLKKSVKITLDDTNVIKCNKVVVCNADLAKKFVDNDILSEATLYGGCSPTLPLGKCYTFPPSPIYILNDNVRLRIYGQRLFVDVLDGRDVIDVMPKIYSYFSHIAGINLEYEWSGRVVNTKDGLPLIGGTRHSNVYLNTAFGYHGLSFAFLGGHIISDCIINEVNDHKLLYPGRFEKE